MKTNLLLILACIGASLWAWQQEPAFAERNLIFSLNNLEKGRVWTLLTSLFVHANVLHLFGNMLFLFVFGNTLEKTVGSRQLLRSSLQAVVAVSSWDSPLCRAPRACSALRRQFLPWQAA
jgi:membrane associated rhomboid family serine protease